MKQPLVSVVTGTWQRHETLTYRLIPALAAQDYENIEHVIVSDGPDRYLRRAVRETYARYKRQKEADRISVRVFNLNMNTSGKPNSYGIMPLLVGCYLAKGKYIVCIPDDDIMMPSHIRDCVEYLEEVPSLGFVYTGFKHRTANSEAIIQATIPSRPGLIASPMFQRELLDISTWQMGDGFDADWLLVQRWIEAGIEYGFIDTPTFEHFANH